MKIRAACCLVVALAMPATVPAGAKAETRKNAKSNYLGPLRPGLGE